MREEKYHSSFITPTQNPTIQAEHGGKTFRSLLAKKEHNFCCLFPSCFFWKIYLLRSWNPPFVPGDAGQAFKLWKNLVLLLHPSWGAWIHGAVPVKKAQTKGTKTQEFGCGLTLTRSTVDITATTPNQPLGTCHVEKWDDQETSSQLLAWLFKVAKLTSTRKRWDTFSFWINNLSKKPGKAHPALQPSSHPSSNHMAPSAKRVAPQGTTATPMAFASTWPSYGWWTKWG